MITRFLILVSGVSLFGCLSFLEPAIAGRLASEMGFNPSKENTVTLNIESQNLASNHKRKGKIKAE